MRFRTYLGRSFPRKRESRSDVAETPGSPLTSRGDDSLTGEALNPAFRFLPLLLLLLVVSTALAQEHPLQNNRSSDNPEEMRPIIDVFWTPHMQMDFDASLNNAAANYGSSFDGAQQPFYRLDARLPRTDHDGWWFSMWHTAAFPQLGGPRFGNETSGSIQTGSTTPWRYQKNDLSVGFTDVFVGKYVRLGNWPVEGLAVFSVNRMILERDHFVVTTASGTAASGDALDVNTISGEGLGLGLRGRHARKGFPLFFRWQTTINQLFLAFDSDTDFTGGTLFNAEGGIGVQHGRWALELGGLWQYFKLASQGDRRRPIGNNESAIISHSTQEIRSGGTYLRFSWRL